MLRLIVKEGQNQGRTLDLTDGEYVVGRSSTCRWCLPADDRVSRQQFLVQVTDGRATLSNLSSFGTILVGTGPIDQPIALETGQVLRLGFSGTEIEVCEILPISLEKSTSDPESGWIPTDLFHPEDRDLIDEGPLTRDEPDIAEAYSEQGYRRFRKDRLQIVLWLALGCAVGAVLLWRFL